LVADSGPHELGGFVRGRTNYLRRAVGVTICLAIPALFVVSLAIGLGGPRSGWFEGRWPLVWSGFFGVLNFYLSFVRGWVHRRRHGSMEGYRYVSGIPLLGNLGLLAALMLGMGAAGTATVGLALCALDTGGLPWFLISTWRDRSFWDDPRGPPAGSPR
jgi:hypothetical protein